MKKIKLWDISNITYWKNLSKKKLLNEWYTVFWANWIIGFFNEYLYEDEMVLISCRWAYSWKINLSPKKSFITNNSLIVDLYIKDDCHKKLVYYFLQAVNKTHIVTWSAQPQVTINNVLPLEIPLPSLPTQRLIVQEIEKQFSRLDEGLDSLKRVKENLKKYKASVLKSAVEWKLTKDWRKSQVDIESASKLLERILEEKKRKFLEENPKKKYKELEGIKTEDIPEIELPDGWCFASFKQALQVFIWSTPSRANNSYWGWDIKWISSWEVKFQDIYETKEKITDSWLENSSTVIHPEWTVMIAMIWEWKTRGQCALLKTPACHNQNTAWIRVNNNFINSSYIYYFLYWNYSKSRTIWGWGNQKALNKTFIENFIFPLPSLQEQNQIVKIVEEKLSVVEKLEKIVEENIKKAENLKQSILKKAFEWRLVEVSENEEEQVEKLLEEIAEEKARMEKEEKQAKRGMRKKKK